MIRSAELRDRLASFLAGEIRLDEFEDWFVQQSWNIHQQADPDLESLVYAIELRLAEHSSEHLSEDQLRDELRPFVYLYSAPIVFGGTPEQPHVQTGTSSQINLDQVVQYRLVGRELVAGFA